MGTHQCSARTAALSGYLRSHVARPASAIALRRPPCRDDCSRELLEWGSRVRRPFSPRPGLHEWHTLGTEQSQQLP